MKRLLDEPSVVHFSSGDDIGDYAFHELQNSEAWFVDELPDGRARWEALPPSHPLSMAWLHRRPQAMAMIPPPLPKLKVPLLEKPSVRVTLLGTIIVAFIGLISMGVRATRAAEPPALTTAAAAAVNAGGSAAFVDRTPIEINPMNAAMMVPSRVTRTLGFSSSGTLSLGKGGGIIAMACGRRWSQAIDSGCEAGSASQRARPSGSSSTNQASEFCSSWNA